MRNELKNKFAPLGIAVPSMPPKRILNDDPAFIKERTQGLTLMVKDIVATPWLRSDSQWSSFMQVSSQGLANAGESMLLVAFAQLEPPANPYQRLSEFKDELSLVERSITELLTAARSMQSALDALDKSNFTLKSAFNDWIEIERGLPKLNGEVIGFPNENLLSNSSIVSESLISYKNMMNTKVS